MKKYGTLITLLVVVFIIILIVAFLKRKSRSKSTNINDPSQLNTGNSGQAAVTGVMSSFPLKKGSKGREVKLMQAALNKYHGTGLDIDGSFGPATETALKAKFGIVALPLQQYNDYVKPYESSLVNWAALQGIII